MTAPLIGVTTYRTHNRYGHPQICLSEAYVASLAQAGALPVLVPLGLSEPALDELVSRLDGMLFSGGGDVEPERYGSQPHPLVDNVDLDRDRVELHLLQKVLAAGQPFLGICRGLQVINIGLGGTLYEDILDQKPGSLRHSTPDDLPRYHLAHPVRLEPNSQLSKILAHPEIQVNSQHHQGIRRLANGLKPTAYAPDGIIEAFEISQLPLRSGGTVAPRMAARAPPDAGAFLLFCRGMQPEVTTQNSPVGLFNSGVGGLSVIRSIWIELPDEDLLFLADQAHVPYGPRPLEEVRQFAKEITRFLLDQGAKLIVVACNAASAAALQYLRQTFPQTTFVGMEPAVKPAVEHSQSKVVAVLATPATFQGQLYASLVDRFAAGTLLLQHTCPGLVAQIEAGDLDGSSTRHILEEALRPMLAQGADTVVLGCTHYPFVIPLIQQIVGPDVRVIDPAPAVARQVRYVLETQDLCCHSPINKSPAADINPIVRTQFLTTGDASRFQTALSHLLGVQANTTRIKWMDGRLVM